uniref:RING/U-box superfamily protein n=1 Tax=Zea mays TaxID=4577 RepID=A0A804R051_MAIZE
MALDAAYHGDRPSVFLSHSQVAGRKRTATAAVAGDGVVERTVETTTSLAAVKAWQGFRPVRQRAAGERRYCLRSHRLLQVPRQHIIASGRSQWGPRLHPENARLGCGSSLEGLNRTIPYAAALERNHGECAVLLNPSSVEPVGEGEEKIIKGTKYSQPSPPSPREHEDDAINEASSEASDAELCCICFEQACTIEVQDYGHQIISRLLVSRASPGTGNKADDSSLQLVRRWSSRRSHNLSDVGSFKGPPWSGPSPGSGEGPAGWPAAWTNPSTTCDGHFTLCVGVAEQITGRLGSWCSKSDQGYLADAKGCAARG